MTGAMTGSGSGERDLSRLLADLKVERRPGVFAFVSGNWPTLAIIAEAAVRETEGVTFVVGADSAREAGAPVETEFAWLTVTAHSALDGVGLTAELSRRLAEAGIACNMIAGYYHDHMLVAVDRVDEAIALCTAADG